MKSSLLTILRKEPNRVNKRRLLSIAFVFTLSALFVLSALSSVRTLTWCVVAPLTILLFGKVLLGFSSSFISELEDDAHGFTNYIPKETPFYKSQGFKLLICLILFRVAVFFIGHVMNNANAQTGFMDGLWLWTKSDSNSYLGIAENGYVNEGDARFHIVFFPLYPLFIRLFSYIFGYLRSALFVSNVCAILGGYMLYRLVRLETDDKTALRSAKYYFILPAGIFLGSAMSDSLFFLLSVCTMYELRRRRFLSAGIFGMLAAFTRSLGLMLAVPFFIEWLNFFMSNKKGERILKTWKSALCVLIIPIGLVGYLVINKLVTGDALRFMTYQKEHWSQSFGFFFDTTAYQTDYLIKSDIRQKIALWLPNLIYIFSSLIIVGIAQKHMRAAYTGYFLAYFAIAIGVTWLLSGPRYLTCAFTLPYALAVITRNKNTDTIATALCLTGFLIYLAFYAAGLPVY